MQILEGFCSPLVKKPHVLHLCPLLVCVAILKLHDLFPWIPIPPSARDRSALWVENSSVGSCETLTSVVLPARRHTGTERMEGRERQLNAAWGNGV